jgi:hypothetical protein
MPVPWLRGRRVADTARRRLLAFRATSCPACISCWSNRSAKCRFLEHVATLALAGVEVVQARAEAYQPRSLRARSRAVGQLAQLVKNAGGLVAGGGRWR